MVLYPVYSSTMAESKKQKEDGDTIRIRKLTKTHDVINVILIAGLTVFTIFICLTNDVGFDYIDQMNHGNDAKDIYIYITYASGLYTIYDIIYIVLVPECTKRQGELILHHIATLGMVYTALGAKMESMTVGALLVEINTLILTVQKLFRLKFLQIPMLLTWFFLRVVWYPVLTVKALQVFSHSRFDPAYWYIILASFIVLNSLNFYWSAEFAMPKNGQGFMKRKDA